MFDDGNGMNWERTIHGWFVALAACCVIVGGLSTRAPAQQLAASQEAFRRRAAQP